MFTGPGLCVCFLGESRVRQGLPVGLITSTCNQTPWGALLYLVWGCAECCSRLREALLIFRQVLRQGATYHQPPSTN